MLQMYSLHLPRDIFIVAYIIYECPIQTDDFSLMSLNEFKSFKITSD